MSEPTAYEIHLLDQLLPAALGEVDELAENMDVRGWLAESGMATAGRRLTQELVRENPPWGLAAAAAFATLRRIEERVERKRLRRALEDIESTCQCDKPECVATIARTALFGGA